MVSKVVAWNYPCILLIELAIHLHMMEMLLKKNKKNKQQYLI